MKVVEMSTVDILSVFCCLSLLLLDVTAQPLPYGHGHKRNDVDRKHENLLWIGSKDFDETSLQGVTIAGYLPDYRIFGDINTTASLQLLDDLILFSIQVMEDGSIDTCCLSVEHFQLIQKSRKAIQADSYTRVWVAVGGAGRNQLWPSMAADRQARKHFLQSIVDLCHRHGFFGIDLDFYSSVRTLDDHKLFLQFLKEASEYWHEQGLYISLPLHVTQTLPATAYSYVDRINLMSYDASTTHASSSDPKAMIKTRLQHVITGVRALLKSGCSNSKIYVGVPFYGTSLGHPGQVKTIADALSSENLADADMTDIATLLRARLTGYQWDSPTAIRLKMELVKKYGLGGVFAWELGQDLHQANVFSASGGLLLSTLAAASDPSRSLPKVHVSASDGSVDEMEL